jgi:hypothetical protein
MIVLATFNEWVEAILYLNHIELDLEQDDLS